MALIRANSGSGGGGNTYMGEFTPPTRAQQTCLIPVSTIGFVPKSVFIVTYGETLTKTSYSNGTTFYHKEKYNAGWYEGSQNISVNSQGVTFTVGTTEQSTAYIMCSDSNIAS